MNFISIALMKRISNLVINIKSLCEALRIAPRKHIMIEPAPQYGKYFKIIYVSPLTTYEIRKISGLINQMATQIVTTDDVNNNTVLIVID